MEPKATVTKENEVWVLRMRKEDGRLQEYRCSSESQARTLAVILTPKPAASTSP